MLSSKARILWIKWHAYLSCFFLPLALLYALTGTLYLFDIKGGSIEKTEYHLEANTHWPETEKEAEALLYELNKKLNTHITRPQFYYEIPDMKGWYDLNGEVSFKNKHDNHPMELFVDEYDIWRQLVFIHKGIVGDLFKVLSILFGISLMFSLLSGTIVALVMPKLKRNAIISLVLGCAVLVWSYFISL
jgi:hypothetical protein